MDLSLVHPSASCPHGLTRTSGASHLFSTSLRESLRLLRYNSQARITCYSGARYTSVKSDDLGHSSMSSKHRANPRTLGRGGDPQDATHDDDDVVGPYSPDVSEIRFAWIRSVHDGDP